MNISLRYINTFFFKDKYNKKKTDEYSMMAVGMNPKPTKTNRDSKIGVKTYDKPKGAKEPYFKKDKSKK